MSLWVRNEKRLNMQCSKVISKDVRAVRSDCTTQEPRRALRITRVIFETLLSCLRRTRLERKSTKNRSEIHENEAKIEENADQTRRSTQEAAKVTKHWVSYQILEAHLGFKISSKAIKNATGAEKVRPEAAPEAICSIFSRRCCSESLSEPIFEGSDPQNVARSPY